MKLLRCPGYQGGDRAEFGILEQVDPEKDYGGEYTPHAYGCIAVCDDSLEGWYPRCEQMETYFHTLRRPAHGFARYGVTLIPPRSLPLLLELARSAKGEGAELLVETVRRAMTEGKYVIHYGV